MTEARRLYLKEYRKRNRTKHREYLRKRRIENPKYFKELARKQYARNPEKFRERSRNKPAATKRAAAKKYYWNNVDIIRKLVKTRYEMNKDLRREYKRQWRLKNGNGVKANYKTQQWRKQNLEKIIEYGYNIRYNKDSNLIEMAKAIHNLKKELRNDQSETTGKAAVERFYKSFRRCLRASK